MAVSFSLDDHILLSALMLRVAAFLVSPIGAVVLGRHGDSHGRQQVLVLVVALMTGATAVGGVLASYAGIGVAAPLTLGLASGLLVAGLLARLAGDDLAKLVAVGFLIAPPVGWSSSTCETASSRLASSSTSSGPSPRPTVRPGRCGPTWIDARSWPGTAFQELDQRSGLG